MPTMQRDVFDQMAMNVAHVVARVLAGLPDEVRHERMAQLLQGHPRLLREGDLVHVVLNDELVCSIPVEELWRP